MTKVDDESGGAPKTKTIASRHAEGQKVRVVSGEPQGMVFDEGRVTAGETDVTDDILPGNERKSATAEFTMTGQALTFTAKYREKVSEIMLRPNDGENSWFGEDIPLPTSMIVAWGDYGIDESMEINQLQWSYESQAGEVICGKGDWTYKNTVYKLVMTVPQGEDLMFTDEVVLSLDDAFNIDFNRMVDKYTITKNPTDGSLRIELIMKRLTDEGAEQPGTDDLCKLTVDPYDLNLQATAEGEEARVYYGKRGEKVTLTAPKLEGESFYSWESTDTDLIPDEDRKESEMIEITIPDKEETSIRAQYAPVVTRVDVEMEDPVEGEPLARRVKSMKVTVMNTFEISKDNVGLTWTPNPGGGRKADYETAYTASCAMIKTKKTVDGEEKEVIHVTNVTEGENYGQENDIIGQFRYADNLEVYVNGSRAICDTENNIVYYTFPQTEACETILRAVKQPDDITGLAYGTTGKGIKKVLPGTAEIVVADRSISEAEINWTTVSQDLDDSEETDETVWKAEGELRLPETVKNKNNVDTKVSVKVTVDGAPYASAPRASVDTGKYLAGQTVILSADTQGGTIHYTTDGSTPTRESTVFDEKHPIEISTAQLKDGFVLKAMTSAAGFRDSAVSVYEYEYQDKVLVPAGNSPEFNAKAQTGVEASAAYTLQARSGKGLEIDGNGNAVATGVGKYTVTAHLKDGYQWKIPRKYDPDDDGYQPYDLTTEDQQITFEINPVSLKGAAVKASNAVYTGKLIKPAVTVTVRGFTVPADYYTVIYTGNKKVGTASVRVAAKSGLSKDSATGSFKIVPKKAVIKSVKAGKKKLTVKLSTKPSKKGGTRYQIRYRKKGTKKWKKVKTKRAKRTIKKLKRKKRYQIQARAYKVVNKKTYYGAWSKVKTSKKIK